MALAGHGWLWVLAGSAAAGGIVLFLQTLQRRRGQSLQEQLDQAFGQHGGQIVGAAVCLWLLLAASGAAAARQIAFEDDLGPLAPAVPLLLAALASRKGQAAAARVSGVLALCLALLYSIVALASLLHVQAAWCRPWGSAADAGLSLCLCLTPACLLFLDGDGQTPRPGWSALAAAVLPGVAALLCSACLSPALTAQLPQPLRLQIYNKVGTLRTVKQGFRHKHAPLQKTPTHCCAGVGMRYFAYSTARLSRIMLTLI